MIKTILLSAVAALVTAAPALAAADKPTIVLVHGAFAEGSSWTKVAAKLRADRYPVVIAANPLRSVEGDAASVAALLATIHGPVVLVGHSYGGVVISTAAKAGGNVKALVYVAGFAPDAGESAVALSAKFPGSALGTAILPAPTSATDVDLYIQPPKFHAVFAADVLLLDARLMQISQRPVTQAALTGVSGPPAWKAIPSWFVYGDADQCIPATVHDFMAQRAAAKRTVVVRGGSHAVMVSHPTPVASLIEQAAASVVTTLAGAQ
jgi:pimeloyl-ACP methyl ester carboxylesterase